MALIVEIAGRLIQACSRGASMVAAPGGVVRVDPTRWLALVELHLVDAFVMAVEAWAVEGATRPPPDAEQWVRRVLAERRECSALSVRERSCRGTRGG